MKLNNYFGEVVKKDFQGFLAENTFKVPYFEVYNSINSANKFNSVKVANSFSDFLNNCKVAETEN